MFSTSLAALAVTGVLTAGSLTVTQPTWHTSYRVALGQVAEQHKPLAVFIGRGQAGYTRLVTDGGLGADTAKLLKQGYVSLYLDVDTASGKQVAEAFQMTEGVVISDKTGGTMALRHEGTVSQAALTGYLQQYQAGQPVIQTQYVSPAMYQQPYNSGPFPNRPVLNAVTAPVVNTLGTVRGMVMGGG